LCLSARRGPLSKPHEPASIPGGDIDAEVGEIPANTQGSLAARLVPPGRDARQYLPRRKVRRPVSPAHMRKLTALNWCRALLQFLGPIVGPAEQDGLQFQAS